MNILAYGYNPETRTLRIAKADSTLEHQAGISPQAFDAWRAATGFLMLKNAGRQLKDFLAQQFSQAGAQSSTENAQTRI